MYSIDSNGMGGGLMIDLATSRPFTGVDGICVLVFLGMYSKDSDFIVMAIIK